jgi:hypothetical protein
VFLDYLKFIALIDARLYRYGVINLSEFLQSLWVLHAPSVMFGLNLLMPSQKHSNRCAAITGTLCALVFICGFFIMPFFKDLAIYFIGQYIGMISILCALSAAIGFRVRKKLDGKALRASISASLILVYFVAWTGYRFSQQYWV